ncbi:hypothetical protein SAMN02910298_01758 [Pseudobutyrivibrio sp. YE44]|uniref:hypothetical protein n=1 Tax=Pseudobutyrivibrio sp. YE44 TaxID=1520802 RepID=UPI00088D70D4|nr:hypothetical protein [Pseudobutyrivibrio sp. YE44]SDB35604.1 hypothetical protein SAMN02910298_01758 [Pseudobutyrivibrio sp. YE44]
MAKEITKLTSEKNVFLNNKKFKTLIDSMSDSSQNLLVDYNLFESTLDIVGTESMVCVSQLFCTIFDSSNSWQPKLLGKIVPTLDKAKDNINFADLMSSDNIKAEII